MIEQSLPRGPEGSPILFVIPKRKGVDIEKLTEANRNALLEDMEKFKFDIIYAVNAGGDSLTGGVDFHNDPALGRDRQMVYISKAHYLFSNRSAPAFDLNTSKHPCLSHYGRTLL